MRSASPARVQRLVLAHRGRAGRHIDNAGLPGTPAAPHPPLRADIGALDAMEAIVCRDRTRNGVRRQHCGTGHDEGEITASSTFNHSVSSVRAMPGSRGPSSRRSESPCVATPRARRCHSSAVRRCAGSGTGIGHAPSAAAIRAVSQGPVETAGRRAPRHSVSLAYSKSCAAEQSFAHQPQCYRKPQLERTHRCRVSCYSPLTLPAPSTDSLRRCRNSRSRRRSGSPSSHRTAMRWLRSAHRIAR